jgi:hypothetical protein
MGEEAARAFDEEVRHIISPLLQDSQLLLSAVSTAVWIYLKTPTLDNKPARKLPLHSFNAVFSQVPA